MASVLVADDSSYVVDNLENILVKAGHIVVAKAYDGEEAYLKYIKYKPDLVTMDITMPGMDGIRSIEKIIKEFPEAKIVIVSARAKENVIYEALEKGAKNYIFKPFMPDDVVRVVNKVLNGEN